jgi:signal transduction histidine kinase
LYAQYIVIVIWRVVRAGLVAALTVGLGGWALERARFGASDQATAARIEAEVQQRIDAAGTALDAIATRIGAERGAIRAAPGDTDAIRRLFDAAENAVRPADPGRTGVTVFNATGVPLAWAGHISELPAGRVDGPRAVFIARGALGLSLVLIEPVLDSDRPQAPRLAVIAAEQLLGPVQGIAVFNGPVAIQTSIAPVSLRAWYGGAPPAAPYGFLVRSRTSEPLVEGEVSPAQIAEAHARWRSGTRAAVWSILGITLLLCAGPLLELRRRTRELRSFAVLTGGLALTAGAVRLVFAIAARPIVGPRTLTSPLDLLLDALFLAALAWLTLELIERRRVARPRPWLLSDAWPAVVFLAVAYGVTGLADAGLLAAYGHFLQRIVSVATLELLHSLLHPVSATRVAVAFALSLLHATVIWTAVAIIRVPGLFARARRTTAAGLAAGGGWLAGAALGLSVLHVVDRSIPFVPILVAVLTAGACGLIAARFRSHERHATQAARLVALFLALLVPAVAMYPSIFACAVSSKERLIATEFGAQAASQREELRQRLQTAADEIDALPALSELVAARPDLSTDPTARAFQVWSQTVLARERLTSAVELYAQNGALLSRFFLNLPELETARHQATSCDWDVSDEVLPLGSSQRPVFRASRGICTRGRVLGSIVLRVMLDYRTLPFLGSQNPYLEWLGLTTASPVEMAAGRDAEFVVYGWSQAPIFSSGTTVWQLTHDVFRRLIQSREPFWVVLSKNDEQYRVYFMNDRLGIFAIGYPETTAFGHLMNVAELATLAGVLYIALVAGATLFGSLVSRTPASGRVLLREVRSSFYRKLFLTFVAAAVVPVVTLAIATRAYFARQVRAGIDQAAEKTVTVAQRLVEDYAVLQQRRAGTPPTVDDQIMVLAARAVDEHVNLFDRASLRATSEPYLFASQLLSKRTPGRVYRAIVIDRLPTFVDVEVPGGFMLAAAPVRAGAFEGIVTVPLESRQQEFERQLDDLDRRVLFAGVLFSLLGGALGYWMAQRIADPVNRLTRATRRIARGDLDAHIAATSSDELRRLVEDFNRMAEDLKRQRASLERTQRLEAWAEMARQVAHDIKNPLTPIQLAAEHARRVNIDRDRPLSPVLDECVNAILAQVKLLRQISAEFSSFASSPTARPEPAQLRDVIEGVVAPYRMGLADRIAIHVEAPADLPIVTIDRTLFARALTNVIENALHAMPGRGRLTIAARADESDSGRSVVIEITDTGVGMDQEALARTFEPYFSTKATGTGLGLAIAKRNMELNGGTIEVRSQRGVGTTVTLTVPTPSTVMARASAGRG